VASRSKREARSAASVYQEGVATMTMRRGSSRTLAVAALPLGMLALWALTSGCPKRSTETTASSVASQPKPGPQAATAAKTGPPEERGEQGTQAEGDEQVPASYASLTNPLAGDQKAAATGKALYEKNCARCHGAAGKGDGTRAAMLDPKPADLTDAEMQQEMTDAAYFWKISEGVAGTAMPSFKGKLSEEERWCLVCCVRTFGPSR